MLKQLDKFSVGGAHRYIGFVIFFAIVLLVGIGSFYVSKQQNIGTQSNAATESKQVILTTQSQNDVVNQDGSDFISGSQDRWIGTARDSLQSYLGLRFTGTTIPEDVEIASAKIELSPPRTQWISIGFEIFAEDTANPQEFSPSALPSDRTFISKTKEFSDNVQWKRNRRYAYDVTEMVQELHKSKGSINTVSFVIQGRGGSWGRKFINPANSDRAPRLVISYIEQSEDVPTSTPASNASCGSSCGSNAECQSATDGCNLCNTSTGQCSVAQEPTVIPTIVTTPPPTGGGGTDSQAFGKWSPNPKWDTCSKELHDSFYVVGPDGKKYPTWHPPTTIDPTTGQTCTFGHEHGRDPKGSDLMPFIKDHFAFGGNTANSGLPFGLANEQLDAFNVANNITTGARHEDHVGHKIEWENNVVLEVNKCSGPSGPGCQDRTQTNITCDFLMKVHQGTHSPDAFANNVHELQYFVECNDGTKIAATKMVPFGNPGEFVANTKDTPIQVGSANPVNSPSGGGVRFIPTIDTVKEFILVPQGQWSLYSNGLYEDWVSSNYLRLPGGQELAYYDPHFAVFSPSRYYDPSKPNNLGRSIDICYLTENNGTEKYRGGACDQITNYGSIQGITYDDPRSTLNGIKREFYFNQTWIRNPNGPTIWYTDPYGRNAQTSPKTGFIKQFVSQTDNYNQTIFESQAIGADRYYGGNGVHAPN